jgi:glycosyltransferase involved in cell wall biosynthesis
MNPSFASEKLEESSSRLKGVKICIDARPLCNTITGIGRYTLEISKHLSSLESLDLTFLSPGPIPDGIKSQLGRVNYIEGTLTGNISRFIWGETILPVLLRRYRADLYWNPAHRLPLLAPRRMASVVTIHDLVWYYYPETMQPLLRWAETVQMPYAIKHADHLVPVSNSTRKSLMDLYGAEPQRCTTVLHGASRALVPSEAKTIVAKDVDDYIVFVGTQEPRKNLERLLEAFALVVDQLDSDLFLMIVGGKGWGNVKLEHLVEKHGLTEFVIIRGYVSDEDLAEIYSNAMGLVMPSLYEGFGLPILEAMVNGLPVITSNNSSMAEIGAGSAILVDPTNFHTIATAIHNLATDRCLRAEMSASGREHARSFRWDNSAAQLLECFCKALGR